MSYEEEQYRRAKKQVKKKKGFYWHLSSYVITGIFFFIMNMTDDPTEIWFYIPMAAWGIGLAFHYIEVFGLPFIGALDNAWEEKEIQKELAKMGIKRPKRLSSETHEIDELDLDNRYHFDKEPENLDKWEDYDNRDMKEIRRDFNDKFME